MQLLTKILGFNFISDLVATYGYVYRLLLLIGPICTFFIPRVFLICINWLMNVYAFNTFDSSRDSIYSSILFFYFKLFNFYMWWDCQNQLSSHQVTKHTFSPPINLYTNELKIHVCIIVNDSLVYFSWTLFSGLSSMLKCLGGLQMAVVWLYKYPPSWKSPHNWPVNLTIKLVTFCDN